MDRGQSDSALNPPIGVLMKLGSIARHVEEGRSASGHEHDWSAVDGLLSDPDVIAWMESMDALALLPVKR